MTAPVLSTFLWRGEPSETGQRGASTATDKGRPINLDKGRRNLGANINTEVADRKDRPKQKARAL